MIIPLSNYFLMWRGMLMFVRQYGQTVKYFRLQTLRTCSRAIYINTLSIKYIQTHFLVIDFRFYILFFCSYF